jgi:hypothetical protein
MKYLEVIKDCLFCNNPFTTTTNPKKEKKCCCLSCSGKYSRSFVDPRNQSLGLKKRYLENPRYIHLHIKICKICKNSFGNKNHYIQTCSSNCYKELQRIKSINNPNCGGETNYKKCIYKGIWMDSSWEKELAEWMDETGIIWERSRKHMFWWTDADSKKRRYYPDFYLPIYNLYVDTKNPYLIECDKEKIKSVLSENKIKIIVDNLNRIKDHLTKISTVV